MNKTYKSLFIVIVAIICSELWANGDYEINLEDCNYLNEYPQTYNEVFDIYEDIEFSEKTYDASFIKSSGDYLYKLRSDYISFVFEGDNKDSSRLFEVGIYKEKYQHPCIKIIGMSKENLKKEVDVSYWSEQDEYVILKSDDGYFLLFIYFEDNKVTSYEIGRNL